MQLGKFKLHIIRECSFRLDGGAMFGVVPKSLWDKVSPADERNRILLYCNLLLIETPAGRVLVETGMGPRWSEKEADRYELKSLVNYDNVLESVGLTNNDVDAVIISHLHFDHAGGATVLKDGKLVPTFPKAKYYAQKGELEFAFQANARARASYRPDDFLPLQEHGVLQLVDGDSEILPGVSVRLTGGHTSHHQVVTFESEGKKGVYFADIIPTKSHLTPPWVMGYDHYPLASCDIKSEYLAKAARENWLVVFDHEPGVPWGHVIQTAEGKFDWQPLTEESLVAV
ncbi:MAG: MBL fold metallo-hydrolase [Candidatus Obscuribacterales bacterium]|nr:MBL fold metallo-hydrolase [Candidatus Obscuribacterales bacterium]